MSKVPNQSKSNQLFLTIMSIMSGIQVVAGGVVLIDVIPADVSGILLLIVGAVNAGVMYYMNGQIVSLDNVVAYQPNKYTNTNLYAGGASAERTGQALDLNTPVGYVAEKYTDDSHRHFEG